METKSENICITHALYESEVTAAIHCMGPLKYPTTNEGFFHFCVIAAEYQRKGSEIVVFGESW